MDGDADERGNEALYLEKLDSLKELRYEWTFSHESIYLHLLMSDAIF